MSNRTVKKAPVVRLPQSKKARPKKAPIVRLPPKSNVELFLAQGSQAAAIVIALIAIVAALDYGEFILAPTALGVLIGLMLGPVAAALEGRGLPPGISALVVFILFIALVGAFAVMIATPLSWWIGRLPQIWEQLQSQLADSGSV